MQAAKVWLPGRKDARAFVFHAVEHEMEVLAFLLCNEQMHVQVGQVDLGHPVRSAKDLGHRVLALHLEVLVPKVGVDRPEVDAAPQLVGSFLPERKECRPNSRGVVLICLWHHGADLEVGIG